MKQFLFVFFLTLFLVSVRTNAQYLNIRGGSVLQYKVDTYFSKYNYLVSVADYSDTSFLLQWKTSGSPVYKGVSAHDSSAYYSADNLMIKPIRTSAESLNEASIRLRLPGWLNDELNAGADTLDIYIDGAEAQLADRKLSKKLKPVSFNGKIINAIYKEYRDAILDITMGIMLYGPDRYWVTYYKDQNMTLQLESVVTPMPAAETPITGAAQQ